MNNSVLLSAEKAERYYFNTVLNEDLQGKTVCAKYIMNYIARISGGGKKVEVGYKKQVKLYKIYSTLKK